MTSATRLIRFVRRRRLWPTRWCPPASRLRVFGGRRRRSSIASSRRGFTIFRRVSAVLAIRLPGPHGGNGHAHAPERDPRLSAAYAHLPDAVGAPVLPMDGEIPSGGIPSEASLGLGVDGNVFGGVSPSQALVPAAAAAREMAAQPGVWMIVPSAGPDGAMGVVRVPLAGYGESSGQGGFLRAHAGGRPVFSWSGLGSSSCCSGSRNRRRGRPRCR